MCAAIRRTCSKVHQSMVWWEASPSLITLINSRLCRVRPKQLNLLRSSKQNFLQCILSTLGILDFYDFQMTTLLCHNNKSAEASCSARKVEKALAWGKKCRRKELQQKISCLISKTSNWNKGHIYSCSLLFPCCYFSAQVVHLQLLSNVLVSHALHPSALKKKGKKKMLQGQNYADK